MDKNYVDLPKAFDKVGHAKLIRKLKKAVYHGRLVHFFYNFLRNRTQRVLANGEISEPLPVTGETPQGAALSPFFFSIFIADVENKMNNDLNDRIDQDNNKGGESWSLLFADDNKIASGIKTNEEMKKTQETLN